MLPEAWKTQISCEIAVYLTAVEYVSSWRSLSTCDRLYVHKFYVIGESSHFLLDISSCGPLFNFIEGNLLEQLGKEKYIEMHQDTLASGSFRSSALGHEFNPGDLMSLSICASPWYCHLHKGTSKALLKIKLTNYCIPMYLLPLSPSSHLYLKLPNTAAVEFSKYHEVVRP